MSDSSYQSNDRGAELLSPNGRARREAMLGELQHAMRRHHRKRRVRRAALAALGMIVIAGIAARLLFTPPSPRPQPGPQSRPIMLVEFVRTQPDIVERYRAKPPPLIEWIPNDASLVQALRDIGRPAGLIRIDGRLQLSNLIIDEPAHTPTPNET